MAIDIQKPFDGRVALRVDRTPEGWRRWYAVEVKEQPGGWLSISSTKRSPGFPTRANAKEWADAQGFTIVS